MGHVAIRVETLGKRYRIGRQREKYKTIRDAMTSAARSRLGALRRLVSRNGRLREVEATMWALKDISTEINRGEIVGIIGRNGAGKSTLLKVLSRITEPTEGYAEVFGRIGSLLEVGTGFHPELTGRENVYLNGAILGMKKVEIERKFDEIVSFAGVERFIDTAVKHYSSGMYLRLAFAVAAHLEPEILLVDEVLAVGDAAFQKKCLGKMEEVAKEGRTVLFVSHNMGAVRSLCQRGILLEDGHISADGDMNDVAERYIASLYDGSFYHYSTDYDLAIESVRLKNSTGEQTMQFAPGDDIVVEICFDARNRIEQPYILLAVQHTGGTCFTANMLLDGHRPEALEGKGVLVCRFKSVPLLPQSYTVKMKIKAKDGRDMILDFQDVASFRVAGDLSLYGFEGAFQTGAVERSTPVIVPYEWTLPDGSTAEVELTRRSEPEQPAPRVKANGGFNHAGIYSS